MLSENGRTNIVRISVFVHSHYSSLYAEYILGTSKFAKSARILVNMYVKNQFLPLLVNLWENIREYYRRILRRNRTSVNSRRTAENIGRE